MFVTLVAVVFALDQGSKAWAHGLPVPAACTHDELIVGHCLGARQPVIGGYWDWELAYNRGAAFSSFTGEETARWILTAIAGIAVLALGFAAWRTRPEQRLRRAAYAVIAAGALGNLVDRVRDGAVTDFVRWHVHEHLWPVFNVADVALIVGIGLLLIERKPRVAAAHTG